MNLILKALLKFQYCERIYVIVGIFTFYTAIYMIFDCTFPILITQVEMLTDSCD